MSSKLRIFGIRHHGPGSARSLRAALDAYQPDAVLVEGPPDADDVLPLAAHADMKPPLALLVYVPDQPRLAAFYPFAMFSPEWIAIRHGLEREIPVGFMDLPQSHCMAMEKAEPDLAEIIRPGAAGEPGPADAAPELWQDPLGRLAKIAGFDDGERWWDHLVESRRDDRGAVFDAIADAMAVLREDPSPAPPAQEIARENLREAYMRKVIRAALGAGHERVAVVCGAWHAPALADADRKGRAAEDAALLKGLAKIKTAVAWTPWSYDRLSTRSGYGAGVASPAYYDLLWRHEQNVAFYWTTRAARLIRKQDLDASSAHIIEAVRLAETLAALRARPQPGLDELLEAALAVLCGGNEAPMELIRRKLIVGDRLGKVPEEAPATPLQQDLRATQKRLRLAVAAVEQDYDLDLRKPLDLDRSHLLHRLRLLRVPWGELRREHGKKGTFHEFWRLAWRPEFVVELISAGRLGTTVASAASALAVERSASAGRLAELVGLLDDVLLADLPNAVAAMLQAIQQHAAVGNDVPQLMEALPALARIGRYGNVRKTEVEIVQSVVANLLARVCIGLPAASASLDDEAASRMFDRMSGVHDAVGLLENEAQRGEWLGALGKLTDQAGLHALVAGRAVRLLHDAALLAPDEVGGRLSLALSTGNDPGQGARWIEGFLSGSGALLVHDEAVWSLVDGWLCRLNGDHFTAVLPLLRRTFATFHAPERRQLGERVRQTGSAARPAVAADFDYAAADEVLPILARILGVGVDAAEDRR